MSRKNRPHPNQCLQFCHRAAYFSNRSLHRDALSSHVYFPASHQAVQQDVQADTTAWSVLVQQSGWKIQQNSKYHSPLGKVFPNLGKAFSKPGSRPGFGELRFIPSWASPRFPDAWGSMSTATPLRQWCISLCSSHSQCSSSALSYFHISSSYLPLLPFAHQGIKEEKEEQWSQVGRWIWMTIPHATASAGIMSGSAVILHNTT